jgi:hypothetical protein
MTQDKIKQRAEELKVIYMNAGVDPYDMAARIEWHRNNLFKLGDKLADECERILGLGLHQNTIERFKAALKSWQDDRLK